MASPRALLKGDYGFFRSINVWPPFVLMGIYSASLSASMSNLIGASRILHALAKDDLFGERSPPPTEPPPPVLCSSAWPGRSSGCFSLSLQGLS